MLNPYFSTFTPGVWPLRLSNGAHTKALTTRFRRADRFLAGGATSWENEEHRRSNLPRRVVRFGRMREETARIPPCVVCKLRAVATTCRSRTAGARRLARRRVFAPRFLLRPTRCTSVSVNGQRLFVTTLFQASRHRSRSGIARHGRIREERVLRSMQGSSPRKISFSFDELLRGTW